MEVDLAFLADAATVDGSGKLNILGVFDRIGVTSFPAQHPRMALVLRFSSGTADAGTHAITIELKDPDGKEVVRLDGNMQVGHGDLRVGAPAGVKVPQVLNLDGLAFEKPGRYGFDVSIDGVHHASVPLWVIDSGAGMAQA